MNKTHSSKHIGKGCRPRLSIHYVLDDKTRGWADCGFFVMKFDEAKRKRLVTTSVKAVTCRKCKSFIAASKSLEKHFDILNVALGLNLPRPRLIKERIADNGPVWADAYFSTYESGLRPTIVVSPAIVIHNGYKRPRMLRGLLLHEIVHYEYWLKNKGKRKLRRISHPKSFKARLTRLVAEFRRVRPRLLITELQ